MRARVKDPINQSRVLVGTFSYSASLVAARMYDSDGCASLGTFLTPTHRTYSPIASARHHQASVHVRWRGQDALTPASSSWTRGRSQSLGAGRATNKNDFISLCTIGLQPCMSSRTRFFCLLKKGGSFLLSWAGAKSAFFLLSDIMFHHSFYSIFL